MCMYSAFAIANLKTLNDWVTTSLSAAVDDYITFMVQQHGRQVADTGIALFAYVCKCSKRNLVCLL